MSTDATEQVLTARWVFPVSGPPLERGTVTIRGTKIQAVDRHGERTADVDLGNVAIIPGLVNAHTHLDLSGARDRIAPGLDFTDWLRRVIAFRRSQSPDDVAASVIDGLTESLNFGTTLLGDIAAVEASMKLPAPKMYATIFRELIGLVEERAKNAIAEAFWSWKYAPHEKTVRYGMSPHAPYSFRSQTLTHLRWLCDVLRLPLAIHLAESNAEQELLEKHSGPFVPFLASLGAWDPTGLAWSAEQVLTDMSGESPVLLIHCNYLSPHAAVPPNASIVYCPRTHAAFGHPPHPFREFLKRGVRVAVGTDSLASNPDLDLLAEARFIRERYPDFPGDQLLRMATLSGAEALGWSHKTGSIVAGKSADLVALPLPDRDDADPHELIFASADPPGTTRRSMWRGAWRE